MPQHIQLEPVDAVSITVLDDNFVDVLMAGSDVARRAPLPADMFEREQLRAEHGYALLLTVERAGQRSTLLYDAGLGRDTVQHNLDVLGSSVADVRAIVLSHGHADHHGGLEGIVRRIGRRRLPLVLHPDAWLDRRVVFPTGAELHLPPPSRNGLEREGVEILNEQGPTLLVDGMALVSGQVERTTDFETGFALQQKREGDAWAPDPWVWDDQGIIFNVRDKGLVVLSSCSHAGVINVLRYARALTAVEHIHAFVGGCHLTGAIMEAAIPRTVAELAAIKPDFIVPGHCTGWKAMHAIAQALPEAFIQTSVGTRFCFGTVS